MASVQQVMLMYGATAVAGAVDTVTSNFDAVGTVVTCVFQTNGTMTGDYSSGSNTWYTDTSPPSIWMSFTSTGTGTHGGGMVAGTRYQLNTLRTITNSVAISAVRIRTYTISFHDASTGGTLLGTKTVVLTVDNT